ncbi:transporter associated domain-containing protein, partial [Aequoribacter sp.]|uniref:transporter associated domain-containing protein n=1 Tax=Aequoribacter sp. TaxID=2847771 RepID=UPI003F699000
MRNISRIVDANGLDREALLREMEQPYFVPENTPLHTQLLNFQQQKLRLGTVVDEYGDVMGLVALEDILEEIVGEFTSSLIAQDDYITPEPDGTFLILGNASIRDVNKALDWSLPTEGPRTISGLMLEILESFPDANVSMAIGEHRLEIVSLDSKVIQSVKAFKAS